MSKRLPCIHSVALLPALLVAASLAGYQVSATLAAQARATQPPAAPVERAAQTGKPAAPKTPARPPAATTPSAPQAAAAPKVEFEKYTLPNGLQVILHVDRKLPIVHVNQWFHVGSKNEKPGRTGFAHLFEHMMFQGSKNVPGEYFNIAEKAGANLREGGVNGTTNNDRTNYFATVPSGNLETILWVESDRLATLLDVTDQKKLDNQRDVVKNERRQGLENQPYGRWIDILFDQLFPRGHPYSWPVIGSMEDLSAASLDDVKDFFRRYYTPNNLSLVIAGDFDPLQVKQLVEKYFGPIQPGPALDRPARWIPAFTAERIVEVADRVPQERTYMVWPAPEYFAPDDAALNLASRILTDGLSSRLNKALVYDKQLCTAVTSFPLGAEIAGALVVQATARPEASLAEIERIVTEQIAFLAKTGPTQAELDRARTKQEFDFISGLERIGGFGGKADLLNQYNVFLGDPGKFEADLGRYRKLTANDVRAAVDRWLNTRNRLLIRFHPEKSGRPAETTLDRSKQPSFGEDRPFKAPTVQTATIENGLELFVVERSDLPKVAITLASRAGAIADPSGKDGLAQLTIRAIDMGTKTRKALDIENAYGDLGTTLGGNVGREYSFVSFEVLKRNLSPALDLTADVVRNATFPDAEVEREKKRQLDQLAQIEKNGGAVASRVRGILAYGADHPYGRAAQGLPRTIGSITRDDLAAFHRDRWKPGSSALIFVGGVTLAEATALAKQHFGGWTGGAAPAVTIPAPKPAAPGKIYLVDRQDAAQTNVQMFLPAPRRETDEYYPLLLTDAVWGGGGFGTRLNLNLREDKGYSYGVFSTLALLKEAGSWYAAGGVQTNKTKESVVEFDKELKALGGAKPITAEEFTTAKQVKTRGYAQQFESYSRVAGQIADLWAIGLPMTELQREYDETVKATLDATLAASKKYARPERASIVLVGDRRTIEAGLRELKLGDVVILDSEGKPATAAAAGTSCSR
jgi:zinc protease